jgi:hypothetical protein
LIGTDASSSPPGGCRRQDATPRPVDQAVELEVGDPGSAAKTASTRPADQLVGNDHAAEGEVAAHGEVLHRGDRDLTHLVVLECI